MSMKKQNSHEKFLLLIAAITMVLTMLYQSCAKADIVEMIEAEARRQHFDPKIAVAVGMVESSLNQQAIGKAGEIGVFQILPKTYPGANLFDLKTNIRLGIQHLKYWERACPTVEGISFVNCYNSGYKKPRYPFLRPYVKKVMLAMEKL